MASVACFSRPTAVSYLQSPKSLICMRSWELRMRISARLSNANRSAHRFNSRRCGHRRDSSKNSSTGGSTTTSLSSGFREVAQAQPEGSREGQKARLSIHSSRQGLGGSTGRRAKLLNHPPLSPADVSPVQQGKPQRHRVAVDSTRGGNPPQISESRKPQRWQGEVEDIGNE